jgi:hypothetical protein
MTRTVHRLFLEGACLSLLAACALAQHVQGARTNVQTPRKHDARGALAILRRDGVMFPFASFSNDDWRISWPVSLKSLEIPVTLQAIPERWWGTPTPGEWRAHLLTGQSLPVEARGPQLFPLMCGRQLGVLTSYQSAAELPPGPVEPFPKDGIVVSGGVPIEPIETVDPKSLEWTPLATTLQREFERVEEETARAVLANTGWRHNLRAAERRKYPMRLESWYRSPSGEPGWDVSYVEAVRAYPARPEDKGCGLETIVSGWLHHYNGELKRARDLRGKITYCDRVGALYMLPLGRIRPKERSYWIFQLSGWEDEWYDVVEVGRERNRYVIEVYAGGRYGCR